MLFYRHSAGLIGVGIERDTNLIVFKAVALEEKLALQKAERNARRREAADASARLRGRRSGDGRREVGPPDRLRRHRRGRAALHLRGDPAGCVDL